MAAHFAAYELNQSRWQNTGVLKGVLFYHLQYLLLDLDSCPYDDCCPCVGIASQSPNICVRHDVNIALEVKLSEESWRLRMRLMNEMWVGVSSRTFACRGARCRHLS